MGQYALWPIQVVTQGSNIAKINHDRQLKPQESEFSQNLVTCMSDRILKIACVGAGYFSQFHYDAWSRISSAQVVGAADRNLETARNRCQRAYDDVDRMLDETSPDIVDIITPPETHLELIEKCLERNVSAIICQKPFCGNSDAAHEAVELARDTDTQLLVHENFRFQPWYRRISQVLSEGSIGKLLQVSFRLRPGDGQGPDAYLDRQPYFQQMPRFLIHETGIHWVDTFRFLCGEPVSVYADLRKLNPVIAGEDAGYFILEFNDGVRACFDGNRLVDHDAENTRCTMGEALVEGTEGVLAVDGAGAVTLRRNGDRHHSVLLEPYVGEGFGGDCVLHFQQHVCDALINGIQPENLALDYLRNLAIEEAIYTSAETGRRIAL